jgi:hypothetical protein
MAPLKVHWNVSPRTVRARFRGGSPARTTCLQRVGLLVSAALTGGKFLPKLNTCEKPIAHKYREGKVKRTLKRESKELEIA